jgi:transposase-like protein
MSVLINLSALLDDAEYFELVRQTRWPQGVRCPKCGGEHVVRNGRDDTQPHCQRYLCNDCQFRFDDLSDTAMAGYHQPLRVWILCLYFMGLAFMAATASRRRPRKVAALPRVLPIRAQRQKTSKSAADGAR